MAGRSVPLPDDWSAARVKAIVLGVLIGLFLATATALRADEIQTQPIDEPARNAPLANARFDRTLERDGIRFRVTCANAGSINTLQIAPSGLEIDNSPISRTIDGTVHGAEIADLDADGSPEIYVYVTSAGSGSYGSLVAYAANRRKSLSEIYLPPLEADARAAQGYMGHDAFAVTEGALVRRFPVYREGDTNARPTGGTRELRYRLVPGEAGWILEFERAVESEPPPEPSDRPDPPPPPSRN